jgi:hypothetical protein
MRNAVTNQNYPEVDRLTYEEQRLHDEESRELRILEREIENERRIREEEERRRREEVMRIEHARILELNRITREAIIVKVQARERLRCMIARGESLPPGTVFPHIPERLGNRCCVSCRVPLQPGQLGNRYTPEVIVDENTRCGVCHLTLFSTWDEQAVVVCRIEEERRVNDLYQAAVIDQERHELVTITLARRDYLLAEVSELERPLRERLEQELLAAGNNQRACERARAKFERELEEAQRRLNRRNRRR